MIFWFLLGFVGVALHILAKAGGARGEPVNLLALKLYLGRHAVPIMVSALTYVVIFVMWVKGDVPVLKDTPIALSPLIGYSADSIWRNLMKLVTKAMPNARNNAGHGEGDH